MAVEQRTSQRLGDELLRTVKVLVSLRQHAPRPHPQVDHTHFPVLFNLAAEPRRVSDLATCVHSDVSTVSRQVSHLVDHGLVAKSPDPRDGRVQILSLTDTGREAIVTITANRGQWFGRVLASWSEKDAHTFLRLLTSFADALEAAKASLTDPAMSLSVEAGKASSRVGTTSLVEAAIPVDVAGNGLLVEQNS